MLAQWKGVLILANELVSNPPFFMGKICSALSIDTELPPSNQ